MAERWVAAVAGDDSSGATDADLDAAAGDLGVELPEDYRALMRRVNGGDTEFGKSWLVLHAVEELVDSNSTFRDAGAHLGFVFFGGDGGGDGYAWDSRPSRRSRYVAIDYVVSDPDAAIPCGETVEEFLIAVYSGTVRPLGEAITPKPFFMRMWRALPLIWAAGVAISVLGAKQPAFAYTFSALSIGLGLFVTLGAGHPMREHLHVSPPTPAWRILGVPFIASGVGMAVYAWFGFRPPLAASVGLAALAILLVVLPMVLLNRRFGKISFF